MLLRNLIVVLIEPLDEVEQNIVWFGRATRRSITCQRQSQREINDLQDTDMPQYFVITKFNNLNNGFIIQIIFLILIHFAKEVILSKLYVTANEQIINWAVFVLYKVICSWLHCQSKLICVSNISPHFFSRDFLIFNEECMNDAFSSPPRADSLDMGIVFVMECKMCFCSTFYKFTLKLNMKTMLSMKQNVNKV